MAKINTEDATQGDWYRGFPIALPKHRNELASAHLVDKLASDYVALIADTTLTAIKFTLVFLGADHEDVPAGRNRSLHEFRGTSAQAQVGLIQNGIDAVISQAIGKGQNPFLVCFVIPGVGNENRLVFGCLNSVGLHNMQTNREAVSTESRAAAS